MTRFRVRVKYTGKLSIRVKIRFDMIRVMVKTRHRETWLGIGIR